MERREVQVLVENQSLYKNKEMAQSQFSQQKKELKALDTSAELTNYVVDSADGNNVYFHHAQDVTKVFIISLLYLYREFNLRVRGISLSN
jgi:hypothetical protein